MDVVGEHHDPVTGGDAAERYEPDQVATESTPPVMKTAITLPIRAKGMLSMTWMTIRTDLKWV